MADKVRGLSVPGSFRSVALLELFTSEGCSSCPSADRLLPELAKSDSSIIPLSFHVDYWNRLGWEDPFSNSLFTERQRQYAEQFKLESIYTPQLVINGQYELVGSNRGRAEEVIKKVLEEKMAVALSFNTVEKKDHQLSFTVKAAGDTGKKELIAVIVQKQATMNVKAGENKGVLLQHTNVVRSYVKKKAGENTVFQVTLPKELADDNWQLIVFAQEEKDGKISGASVYIPRL